jgi:hypothetical protein
MPAGVYAQRRSCDSRPWPDRGEASGRYARNAYGLQIDTGSVRQFADVQGLHRSSDISLEAVVPTGFRIHQSSEESIHVCSQTCCSSDRCDGFRHFAIPCATSGLWYDCSRRDGCGARGYRGFIVLRHTANARLFWCARRRLRHSETLATWRIPLIVASGGGVAVG